MTISIPAAHAIAIALVVADIVARGFRLQWILRGMGRRISWWESVVINAFGDAAAALTPLRIGGQPARFLGLLHAGITGRVAFAALAVESVVTYAVVILGAAVLGVLWAPDWWATAGPELAVAARRYAPWLALVVVASVGCWLLARRLAPTHAAHSRHWLREMLDAARGTSRWAILAAIPLSIVNVFGRVLILPVLVLSVPGHPPIGAVMVGSFALLYSQLVLPTPSGAGAVELGFLAGAAGELGAREERLLFFWRLYTTLVLVGFGLAVAIPKYGKAALARVLRGEGAEG